MGGLIRWLDSTLMYIAAVTGVGALCFVAMRLLA